jgi:hypothetical protein
MFEVLRHSLSWKFLTRPVQPFMAAGAQGNQVQIVIRALLTA